MNAKQFIKSLPTQKQLCDNIGWDRSSMSQWLNGDRPIPEDKEIKLIDEIEKVKRKLSGE